MRHKIIRDSVFRSEVIFYICEDGNKAVSHAKKKYSIVTDAKFDGYKGTCMELYDEKTCITFWFVWIKDSTDWKTLVHEAAHLVFRILDKRGIKYSSENDETFCYLQDFFVAAMWHKMCSAKDNKCKLKK